MSKLSKDDLFALMDFHPETGQFYWRERGPEYLAQTIRPKTWNKRRAGKAVHQTKNTMGYFQIKVLDKIYLAHRLVWLFTYGDWPQFNIDHIDGERTNNAVANLRDVPQSENMLNVRLRKDNASGVTGVAWNTRYQRWDAVIRKNGVRRFIGSFKDKDLAIQARLKAQRELGFHDNHGRAST